MPKPVKETLTRWRLLHEQWPALTFYQRFESVIALTFVVTIVIVVALYRLFASVIGALVLGALDPLEHATFQSTRCNTSSRASRA